MRARDGTRRSKYAHRGRSRPAAIMSALAILMAACAHGAASDVAEGLVGTRWLADDIGGRGVIDYAQSTLEFTEPRRVVGSGACNRFTGPATIEVDTLALRPLAATRRACPPAVMDQEAKFFAALDATRRWEVAPDAGLLRLYDASGAEVVRLSRLGSSAG